MDAQTIIEGVPLLLEAARGGYSRFRRWREPDNFGKLENLLNKRFERHEFLYGQDWTFLRTDAVASDSLDSFFVNQSPLRPALVGAVEKHLSIVSDAAPPRDELAEDVVVAIESLANELWTDETDRIIFELRRLVGPLKILDTLEVQGQTIQAQNDAILEQIQLLQADNVRVVSFAAAPDEVRPDLERLAQVDEASAVRLNDALLGGVSVSEVAESLIDESPGWISEGAAAGEIWHILGRITGRYGRWDRAEQAYLRAADVGFSRPATAIAKAGEAAGSRGDAQRFDDLLDRAERIDETDTSVSILRAERLDNADARLARLERTQPSTRGEESALFSARARAHLLIGDLAAAETEIEKALEREPRSLIAREMKATVALFRGQRQLGRQPNVDELRDATQTYLDLRATLTRLGRRSEAARILGRAVEASYIAGERMRALELLEEAASPEEIDHTDSDARVHLAELAITLRASKVARGLLPSDDDTEAAQLVRTVLQTTEPEDAGELAEGIRMLDTLVSSTDPSIAGQAAISRLGVSMREVGPDWSDEAEQALRRLGREDVADGIRAMFLQRKGDATSAEALLLRSSDPRSLDLLVDAAADSGDYELAIQRSERVLEVADSSSRRVDHAELLLKAGRVPEARAELAQLRRDPASPTDVRAKAYFLSLKDAYDAGRLGEAETLAAEWMELEPTEEQPAWVRLEALLVLGRADEAVAVADAVAVEPDEVGKAQLLAHIYLRGLPAAEALHRIIELSDRFDRHDEKLEGMVVAAWTQAGGSADPEDAAHGALSLNEFPERFPANRGAVRAVAFEDLEEILRQQAAAAAELDALGGEVLAGRLPVATWALAASMSIVGMWSGLQFLPLTFADPKLQELDQAGAAEGVGRGAVWDAASLVAVAVLDDPIVDLIRNALPLSLLGQSVMQDVDFAAIDAVDDRPAEGELRVAWDERANQPVSFMRPAEQIERERRIVRAAFARAKSLEVRPDTDPSVATQFDEFVPARIGDLRAIGQAATAGTAAIAVRERLPVYTDDRVLRLVYRQAGIPTFGTVAMLEILAQRSMISAEEHRQALEDLRTAGAIEFLSDEAQP
jgi:tetratricopeptide (TPR) repeat protein